MTMEERLVRDGDPDPVLFYQGKDPEWGAFSNFSRHPLWMPHPFTGVMTYYETSEHRFQAMKATTAKDHDYVNTPTRPSDTKARGREIRLREDWNTGRRSLSYMVMLETVLAKATQHYAMREALRATGAHMIYEDSPTDDIWGWRYGLDYRGKNLLGCALMQVRELVTA